MQRRMTWRARAIAAAGVVGLAGVALVGSAGVAKAAQPQVLSYASLIGGGIYQNPVAPHDAPDPDVIRSGSSYFSFTTASSSGNVPELTSTDLVHWSTVGDALPQVPGWSSPGRTWAPGVVQLGNRWLMYYATHDNASGQECLSVAGAATVLGPFVDSSQRPLVCQVDQGGSIDPDPFVAPDGRAYLVWKSNNGGVQTPAHIWSAPLAADGLSLGAAAVLFSQDQPWESTVENPFMVAVGGAYDVFYSGGLWDTPSYAIGYALCVTPMGPCIKHPGPIMGSAGPALGPGGESLFQDGVGQWWMAYAAWTSPSTTYRSGGARTLRIDKVSFSGTTPYISGPTWTPQLVTEPVRVAGADRYATAAALAGRYAPGVPVVYLATGQRFSDALAAGPAGAVNHGPVLLTTTSSLPAATAAELSRLAPHEVVVLGGASAVSATVVSQVAAITHVDVARLAGADRYATAAAISAATFSSHVAVVYVATGATFPDALTGSAAAAHMGAPVLLVSPSGIPESTAKELTRLAPSSIVALGGSQALSTSVVAGLSRFSPNVTQVAGPDRYATAAALAGQTFQGPLAEVLLATGTSFPDALAAAPFGEPVLLVPHTGSSVAVTDELAQLAPQRILPVGGPSAVSDSALVALR